MKTTENQRLATLLKTPDLLSEMLPRLKKDNWSTCGAQWIWEKIQYHYATNGAPPSLDILQAYTEAKNQRDASETDLVAARAILAEVPNQTPSDLAFFKEDLLHEARITETKDIIAKYVNEKDYDGLTDALNDLRFKSHKQQRRMYSLSQIKNQRSTMGDVLLNDGLLCRKEGIILAGQQGCGKSTLITQLAIAFSQGKQCLGFRPHQPLKILILQCEDGQLKLEKMFDDITSQIGPPTEDILQVDESYATSEEMFRTLNMDVARHTPDLIIINPFFGYLRGDMNNNLETQDFLYNRLTGLLQRHNAAAIVVHHLTKDKTNVYGSSVLGAWARETIRIDEVDAINHVYRMSFLKRTFEYGARSTLIQWSKDNLLCWELTNPNEQLDSSFAQLSKVLSPGQQLSIKELLAKAQQLKWNIAERALYKHVEQWVKDNRLIRTDGVPNFPNKPITKYSLNCTTDIA